MRLNITENTRRVVKLADWKNEGEKLFGPHGRNWKFKCCQCGHIQSGRDFVEAGMTPAEAESRMFFSCIGRWVKGVGCDWTLGGLFQFHTVEVEDAEGKKHPVFEFGEAASASEARA